MNRRIIALLLVAAMALALGGISVFAADDPSEADQSAAAGETVMDSQESDPETDTSAGEDTDPAGTENTDETQADAGDSETEETDIPEEVEIAPDPAGVVSFANLADRVREGDLNYLVLQENVARIEANDYEQMKEDLRKALNETANAQWALMSSTSQIATGDPVLDGALQGIAAMSTASASQSLQAQYDALREQFEALKNGEVQAEAADAIRQLQDTQNSIVMLAEGMYIQLAEMSATNDSLVRSLEAMDRQIEELELRYTLGQISALSLQQAKAGRTTLISKQQTLAMSMETGLMNLEAMIGADLTGEIRLTELPKVTEEQLSAMDLEADLAAAEEVSYTLYAAQKTLDDAEQEYKDAGREYGYNEKNYQYIQAQHTWQAAQYTYAGAVQSFELSFRSLYAQVKDYKQVLDAAKTSLAVEQDNYASYQLKYEQGSISRNTLLSAQDDLSTAQDTVASAERNLFSAYNNYRWAVDYGILN